MIVHNDQAEFAKSCITYLMIVVRVTVYFFSFLFSFFLPFLFFFTQRITRIFFNKRGDNVYKLLRYRKTGMMKLSVQACRILSGRLSVDAIMR